MHGPLHFSHMVASPWRVRASSPSRFVGYTVALVVTLIAFALSVALQSLIQPHLYAIFYVAVILAAWYGGPGAGLVACILSVVASEYLFSLPGLQIGAGANNWIELSIFVAVSLSIAAITALRNRAEAQGREQREAFRETLASIGEAVIVTDVNGDIVYMNAVAECTTGWHLGDGQALGAVFNAISLDTNQPAENPVSRALRENTVIRSDHSTLLVRRDGSRIPIDSNASPIHDEQNRLLGVVLVFRDMSEHRRAEQEYDALLVREQAARAAAEQSAEWIGRLQGATAALSGAMNPAEVADISLGQLRSALGIKDGKVVLLDESGTELRLLRATGDPAEMVQNLTAISIKAPLPAAETVRTGRFLYIESRDELTRRFPALELGPSSSDYAWMSIPLTVGESVRGAIVLSFEAPRTLSADEQELALALANECAQAIERARLFEQAQQAIRVRDDFFHVASHELKTPLTTLMGYTELLQRQTGQDTALDGTSRRFIDTILNQTQRLNRMITTLLDASRIDTGQLRLDCALFDLAAVTRQLADEQQLTLRRHRIEVTGVVQGLTVNGDELRIEQVIQNLLQNAVKYSPDGGTVLVTIGKDREMGTVAVADHGIGIPAREIPNIFERFYRAANAETQNITGMGIGLHVAREIVEQHGGTITVESREREGSTFTLSLPLWDGPGGA